MRKGRQKIEAILKTFGRPFSWSLRSKEVDLSKLGLVSEFVVVDGSCFELKDLRFFSLSTKELGLPRYTHFCPFG